MLHGDKSADVEHNERANPPTPSAFSNQQQQQEEGQEQQHKSVAQSPEPEPPSERVNSPRPPLTPRPPYHRSLSGSPSPRTARLHQNAATAAFANLGSSGNNPMGAASDVPMVVLEEPVPTLEATWAPKKSTSMTLSSSSLAMAAWAQDVSAAAALLRQDCPPAAPLADRDSLRRSCSSFSYMRRASLSRTSSRSSSGGAMEFSRANSVGGHHSRARSDAKHGARSCARRDGRSGTAAGAETGSPALLTRHVESIRGAQPHPADADVYGRLSRSSSSAAGGAGACGSIAEGCATSGPLSPTNEVAALATTSAQRSSHRGRGSSSTNSGLVEGSRSEGGHLNADGDVACQGGASRRSVATSASDESWHVGMQDD